MKRFLGVLWCTVICLSVDAQVKPIYFIGDSITTNKKEATSYGVSGKLSTENIYVLKVYDLNDDLLQTGSIKMKH